MTYLTVPFFTYIFAVLPVWLPLLVVDLAALYILLFRERFDPRTFVFWVAIVFILPFAGFILYLMFGCTLFMRSDGSRKHASDRKYMAGVQSDIPDGDIRLSRILSESGADIYTSGNDVRLHWDMGADGRDFLSIIETAERTIHLEIFGLPRDKALVQALERKARDGLEVRLITSVVGFGRTPGLHALRSAGVRHATFHSGLNSLFMIKTANRCLREILVVDGDHALTGLGAGIEIKGPAAARLDRRFIADWEHASGEVCDIVDYDGGPKGGCGIQCVSSGPDSPGLPMLHGYSELISGARQRLYVTFPYLVPTDDMYNAVKQAAIAGTDVRILIPAKCRHWYQAWNSLAASNPLMMSGVRVYFAPKALVKCLAVADGKVCAVGSGIFNSRSMRADYGENVVVFSEDAAGDAEREFLSELEDATECLPEEYSRRSFTDMLKIAVSRMFMFFN